MDRIDWLFGSVIAGVLILIGFGVWLGWYSAGVQQQVWERQGIHLTQWEVWCGAKPALVTPLVEGQ